jgi:hypothetical protein
MDHRPSSGIRLRADGLLKYPNRTFDKIHGMESERADAVVFRFSIAFKSAVFLITLAALLVCIPRAVQAIPAEAIGLVMVFLLVPGVLVYGSFFVLTYQIQILQDGIGVEAIPNPFRPSIRCRYADISGIEKDTGWSSLAIFRFREPEPFRISHLEILECSPAALLEKIQTHIPTEVFTARITDSLRRWWKWHRLLANSIWLMGAGWLSILLLDAGGWPAFLQIPWGSILAVLLVAVLVAELFDLLILRILNRET